MKGFLYLLLAMLFFYILTRSCNSDTGTSATVVGPSVDKNGRFKKAHVRKDVSSNPNAVKMRNKSKYYYNTRGKYHK